jgi:hypothetical protein
MMEATFMNLPGDVVGYAYAWSLGVVEYIVAANGMGDIERMLDRIRTESSVEAAVQSTLRMNYPQLETETVRYLRRTYLQQ